MRARPVADAPVEALVGRADELAGRWASVLVASRTLSEMTEVPLQEIAREGPALCAHLARALRSDDELERLLRPTAGGEHGRPVHDPAGASSASWLARTDRLAGTVGDVELLRGVVWDALVSELEDPPARQVGDLADRLAFACAALLGEVLDGREVAATGATASVSVPTNREQGHERVLFSSAPAPGTRRAVLIDERDETPGSAEHRDAVPVAGRSAPQARETASRPRAPDQALTEPAREPSAVPRARPWDIPLDASIDDAGELHDAVARPAFPDGAGAEMRVTRRPDAAVDERA